MRVRILHARLDVAGQSALLAQGQRELGHVAVSYADPHPFGYNPGPDVSPRSTRKPARQLDIARFMMSAPFRFQVVHFHSGSFLPPQFREADARAYRRFGRKVVIEFWGSDARLDSVEAARNPFYRAGDRTIERIKNTMLGRWAEITDGHVIFPDHAFDRFLKPHFDQVHVVRHCVNTRALPPHYPADEVEAPLVVHAPSNPVLKGTKHVREAIRALRENGLRFRYLELTDRSHNLVVETLRNADIVVDQLILGSHGILAVEAMSLGKPVICYILPELVHTYPSGFPIINANPVTLLEVLAECLTAPERRAATGRASRSYAERVHDSQVVAAQALAVYEELP